MKAQKAIVGLLTATLAAFTLRSFIQIGAKADSDDIAAISISTVIAAKDNTFSATLNLDKVPKSGLSALDLAVAYDGAAVDITQVELLYDTGAQAAESAISKSLDDSVFSYENLNGELRIRWATALKNADYWLREARPLLRISGKVDSNLKGYRKMLLLQPANRETSEGSGVRNTQILAGYVDASGKAFQCKTECTHGAVWTMLDETGATMRGDLDMDARVTMADVVLLNRVVSEQEKLPLGAVAYANADWEQDGILTVRDVSLMLRYLQEQ